MGVDTQRPPLPAPTETSVADDSSFPADDLATDLSRRTDRSHFSIPDDGTPVTITTKSKDKLGHGRQQSQTSLLIEYFEAGKTGDKVHSRPSVRVRVTPSTKHRRSKTGHDHVEITQTDKDRKPSYTRRISLPTAKGGEGKAGDASEVSYSSESNVSGMPPVDIEVLQNASDLSRSELSQGRYVPATSDISSMPPDSMLEGSAVIRSPITRRRSRSLEREEVEEDNGKLKAPTRRRSRSLSKERIITERVMEKLAKEHPESSSKLKQRREKSISREQLAEGKTSSRRKPSRSRREEALISGTESSLLTSELSRRSGDTQSIRSGMSTTSINNPKLLATVEDAIKRLILPEINALKEHQTRDKYDRFNRESLYSTSTRGTASTRGEPKRTVSKSSSAPNVKVVLNRDDKDPGVVLSGDSVRSKRSRRPSRDSGSEMSYDRSESTVREEEMLEKKKNKDKRLRDMAIAGAVGAGLTAAALKHHDSETSMDRKERRKKRSKSRSRSASISESIGGESQKERVPPLPMQSELHGSELTRESILSADTERPSSSRGATPIREVSRGTPRPVTSPAPSTPTRTPAALRRGPNSNASLGGLSAPGSAKSDRELSARAKAAAALAAAGIGGAALASQRSHSRTPTRELRQSDLSFEDRKENLTPQGPRSVRSVASISSAGKEASRKLSELSLNSAANSPSTNAARSRRRSDGLNLERKSDVSGLEAMRDSEVSYEDGTATPRREHEADQFFEYEHQENDALRAELDDKRLTGYTDESLRSSNPLDFNRLTTYTDDSMDGQYHDRVLADEDVHEIGGRPDYVPTPAAVESAVASLVDPSTVSTSVRSSQQETGQGEFFHMDEPYRSSGENTVTAHPGTSGERWAALRDQAKRIEEYDGEASPTQSEGGSYRSEEIEMTHNAIPFGEPMPEIGHGLDNESDVTTNPSEIQGPARTPDRWPYEPTPPMSTNGLRAGEAAAVAGGAAAAALAAAHMHHDDQGTPVSQDRHYQPSVEDDFDDYGQPYQHEEQHYPHQHMTPTSAGNWKDEGYISAAQPGYTPEPQMDNTRLFDDSGLPDMSGDLLEEDPFAVGGKPMHTRNFSGNSHGMTSPLYDSATGKGLDRIQSKDIVALMDHLTVRDAQRNARDTEILVTLVRSAAEMRNSFEEMKKFIAVQDKMIMNNTDRDADLTIQKLLQGPRPQPSSTARLRGRSSEEVDDQSTKRKNVFRRALKGLSMKNSNELTRIEDMLMHLLDEVEGLKDSSAFVRPPMMMQGGSQGQSMTSYENLRAAGDPGYEPEGRANTASTPNQSGTFSNPSSRHLGRHSGYDGRRGSEHRISTVLEGDEDLEDHEAHVLDHQFENNERLLTPTEEVRRSNSMPHQEGTPPDQLGGFGGSPSQENTPKIKAKHKSNSSSIFGIPKISRWSKTTASTDKESSRNGKKGRPYSQESRSGSNMNINEYDEYELNDEDRFRSNTSLPGQQRGQSFEQDRSPSPLIPDEMDGPKYQAHRNSLNLEHPQPRPGPTHRHQTHLESQAINFDDPQSPDFDQWGSAPSLALNRNRFGNNNGHMSPLSDGGYSNHSASEQVSGRQRDDGPLVPQAQQQQQRILPFGAKQMYSSPLSSGQLLSPLPPIEEVRYSLETDRHSLTPSPRMAANMRSPGRKITGPRPMGSRSPRPIEHSDTVVRRKPVAADNSPALESYRSSLDSFERDTF